MPIAGIGTDIIEIDRIQKVCEREEGFLRRVYTEGELKYSLGKENKYLHLAGRFAVKEAVGKALGQSFSWQDVEVINGPNGKPSVTLHGKAKGAAGGAKVHISLSHTENYATAVAIVEAD